MAMLVITRRVTNEGRAEFSWRHWRFNALNIGKKYGLVTQWLPIIIIVVEVFCLRSQSSDYDDGILFAPLNWGSHFPKMVFGKIWQEPPWILVHIMLSSFFPGINKNVLHICWSSNNFFFFILPETFGEYSNVPGWWFGTWILCFHSVGNVIIPTDFQSIIFQRGRAQPPTRYSNVP